MKTVLRLLKEGKLTARQAEIARQFFVRPALYNLPHRFRTILQEVVIDEIPLEQIESQHGWPRRSAKAILSEILLLCEQQETAIQRQVDQPGDREVEVYLYNKIGTEIASFSDRYRLTPQEAKLMAALHSRIGRVVSYHTVITALFPNSGEPDDAKNTVKVVLHRLRKKIAPHGFKILSIHGQGLKMLNQTASEAKS